MNNIKAEIVAHSLNPQGDELISVLATFPRIILAEVNTHRMLSKNTSSSRAIPLNKMIEAVQKNPFIPIAWQKKHSGMQGSEYFDNHFSITGNYNSDTNYGFWMDARDEAVRYAECLGSEGLTKQLANRLLEPFMWTTMLITGSKEGWDNFFRLRCPSYQIKITKPEEFSNKIISFESKKDFVKFGNNEELTKDWTDLDWLKANKGQAEIHIMDLAEKIWDARNESTPKQLKAGEWHIPFEDKIDYNEILSTSVRLADKDVKYSYLMTTISQKIAVMISTAMGARTSYTVVGDEKVINYENMIALHDRLLNQEPPHSSPLEHCCIVPAQEEYNNSIKGQEKGWFMMYKGFKSYRQIIEETR